MIFFYTVYISTTPYLHQCLRPDILDARYHDPPFTLTRAAIHSSATRHSRSHVLAPATFHGSHTSAPPFTPPREPNPNIPSSSRPFIDSVLDRAHAILAPLPAIPFHWCPIAFAMASLACPHKDYARTRLPMQGSTPRLATPHPLPRYGNDDARSSAGARDDDRITTPCRHLLFH